MILNNKIVMCTNIQLLVHLVRTLIEGLQVKSKELHPLNLVFKVLLQHQLNNVNQLVSVSRLNQTIQLSLKKVVSQLLSLKRTKNKQHLTSFKKRLPIPEDPLILKQFKQFKLNQVNSCIRTSYPQETLPSSSNRWI
jgi:hypothetical protein